MSRPDPLRLDLRAYPCQRPITTRVSDMDGYGHLNAIRIGHYYEDARAAFYGEAMDRTNLRMLVAQLTIRYLGEGFWPGEAIVATGILRLGVSSFEMGQALFQNGRCIGLCDTVLVNTEAGVSAPFPEHARRDLEKMLLRAPETAG